MGETDDKYRVRGIEVFRCLTDGRLMTESLCRRGWCAGHRLAQPAYPSARELLTLLAGEKCYNAVMSSWWRLLAWLSR